MVILAVVWLCSRTDILVTKLITILSHFSFFVVIIISEHRNILILLQRTNLTPLARLQYKVRLCGKIARYTLSTSAVLPQSLGRQDCPGQGGPFFAEGSFVNGSPPIGNFV